MAIQETRFVVKPNEEKQAWELLEQHGDMERLLAHCYDGNEHRSLLATAIAVFLNTGMLSIDEPGPGEAGALYAFMGWLTTREQEAGPFSAHHNAGEACELVAQFIKMQGWPNPPDGWHHAIKPYIEAEDPGQAEVAFVANREYELELANAQDTIQRLAGLLFDCASILRHYHHSFSPKFQSATAVLLDNVAREDLGRLAVSGASTALTIRSNRGSSEIGAAEVLPGPNPPRIYKEMPNPTPEQVKNDPAFQAIWQVIKTWDVNAPEYYFGYCGANGSHVALILNALQGDKSG
jgi:hypothetical protein